MSAIKGFSSIAKGVKEVFGAKEHQIEQKYQTVSRVGEDEVASDTTPRFLNNTGTTVTLDAAGAGVHTKKRLAIAAHGLTEGAVLIFTTGLAPLLTKKVQVESVLDAGNILLDRPLPADVAGGEILSVSRYVEPAVDSSGSMLITEAQLTLVDSIDDLGNGSGPGVIDTQFDIIPAQLAAPLLIVAALAADVSKIFVTGDAGEFVEIYSDAAGLVKIATLNLTPDFSRSVFIPAGTSIYISNVKNASIGPDVLGANSLVLIDFMG